jgi:hypothetical protein
MQVQPAILQSFFQGLYLLFDYFFSFQSCQVPRRFIKPRKLLFQCAYMLNYDINWSNRLSLVIVWRKFLGDTFLDKIEVCGFSQCHQLASVNHI